MIRTVFFIQLNSIWQCVYITQWSAISDQEWPQLKESLDVMQLRDDCDLWLIHWLTVTRCWIAIPQDKSVAPLHGKFLDIQSKWTWNHILK